MNSLIVRAIALLVLPTVINIAGGYFIMRLSHAEETRKQLASAGADEKGLGLRFLGYNTEQVENRWSKLDARTLRFELLGLEIDLIYPFLYGAMIVAALLCAWAALGKPFAPVWLIVPVAITMIADWTENCIQLAQLKRFDGPGHPALQSGWIRIASAATITKWVFLSASSLLLIGLAFWMVRRNT